MPKLCFMLSFGDLPLSCPMIERIICEDEPATDDNIEEIGRIIDRHMREFFQSCAEKTPDEIAEQRYERFRKI